MAIDYERLMALNIPDSQSSYGPRDAMLYALSLGVGSDPTNEQQLRYCYEQDLRVLPTMGVVLAHPGYWPRLLNTGLDWVRIVHAEQGLVLHKALPPQADVIGHSRIVEIVDKGADKGAFLVYERRVLERSTGEPLCTISQTMLCRGDGGFGGPPRSLPPPHRIPERTPDAVCDLPTLPQTALLYRLNGDWNPLHADPQVARKAGFERPILHGLASFGIANYAVVTSLCNYDADCVASIFGRFTAPVFPGETLRTEMWADGDVISYRVSCLERGVVAINNGRVELRSMAQTAEHKKT
jgi:acyl dehydratase